MHREKYAAQKQIKGGAEIKKKVREKTDPNLIHKSGRVRILKKGGVRKEVD